MFETSATALCSTTGMMINKTKHRSKKMGWKVHLPKRPTGDAVERWVQIAALLKSPTSVEQATDSKPELVKILNERCFFHLEGFHKIRMLLHQRSFMTLMFCCVFFVRLPYLVFVEARASKML